MKIKHKITLGFVGLTLLIVAIGYVSLHTSQTTLEKAIGEQGASLAAQVVGHVNRNTQHRIEVIQSYAKNELVRDFTAKSNREFSRLANPDAFIEQVESDWTDPASDLTPLMQSLTVNELAMYLKSLSSFYNDKYGYPMFAEVFVTNAYGANIAQTNKTTDYYQKDEPWWQTACEDELYTSDVGYDQSAGVFSLEIASRINDAHGNPLGVIKAILNIQETINIINEAKSGAKYKTLQLHLANKDGRVIYSTKGYKFLDDISGRLNEKPEDKFYWFGSNADPPEGEVSQKADNKGLLFAYARSQGYRDFSGLGWGLLAEISTDEVFAPIAELKKSTPLAAIAVTAMALLASIVTCRSITVPITGLQKATLQITAGNLETDLKTGTDEIGSLAGSFQKMAQQLKKTIADLNNEIAERKKSEEKLRDLNRFLDNIFDSIQDGIGIMDKDLNIIKVNSWMENVHRRSMPLAGKKCYEAYHNRNSPCSDCPSVITLKTGKPQSAVIANPCKGHKAEWVELSTFPLKDHQGNVTGVIEYVKDVTERRKAEMLLAERAEQTMQHHNTLLRMANMPEQDIDALLRTAVEQDAEVLDVERVGVWFFSSDKTEIVCRNQFTRTGKTHTSGETLKVRDYPAYFKSLQTNRIIATNDTQIDARTREFTAQYLKPKGITSMIDVPIRLHGQIAGILCHEHVGAPRQWSHSEQDFAASVADMISLKMEAIERSKAEKRLEQLNKDLKATIDELSRTNRQIQDFVHIAAHDLKTPVRGIGTLADWIISDYGDKFDNRGREQVRLLKARVVRIDKLIEGMLAFSKIVRNRRNEKEVNLGGVLTEIIKNLEPADNVEIAVDSLPAVTCEYSHITQVFENLAANAVMFMDKPKGLIKVGCVEQGDFWKFYVSDNGPGIEQRHFERIFKIFQTLPKTDEPDTVGIGLAIAKKIVELYGGKIWVESHLGQGSTFYFTFPKQQEELTYEHSAKANTAR